MAARTFLASGPPARDALDARYALALCQSALKQHAQAAETLATLLKEKPDYERADQVYYEMGHSLLLAMKGKEAVEAFRQLAARSPDEVVVLRERVTSKGGTTYAALASMEQAGVKQAIVEAIKAASQRGRELGEQMGAGDEKI